MKNVINSLMTLAAAAAALVSCSRQEVEVKDNSWFVYRFKIVEGQTKATLDQDGVKWEVDKDDVGVIVNDENIRASVVDNNGIKEISFTTESAIAEGTPIYAYYPYSEAVTSADAAQVTIPTNQEGGSVSAMPMAGIPIYLESAAGATSNGTINFLNLGAIIDFRIYSSNANYANETVESVTFKSNSDEVKASGTATIDLTAVQGGENPSAPDMTMSGVSNRRATLKQSVPVAANKDAATTPMYLVVAPGTFSGTVTVNTNVASYTFTLTDKALARNTITKFNMNIGSSKAEREGKTYEYVTDLTEGTYLMVGSETSGSKQGLFVCLFPEAPTKTWTDSQNRTFTGHVLNQMKLDGVATDATSFTTTDATIVASEVELVQSGTSNWLVKVKANNQYLKAPTEDYVITYAAAESGAAAFTAGTVSEGKRNFTTSGGSSGNSTYYFYHSSSADGFSIRTSQTQNMRFYKPSGNPQTISFINVPDGGYTWDIGKNEGTYARPELSGALTTVTYTSDKPTVATVDEKTGVVIFGGTKTGTVTITATAASEDGFASATASYTIKVSNSNVTENIYKKVTAVEVGETYLIVYEGSDTYGPKVFQPTFENNTFSKESIVEAFESI